LYGKFCYSLSTDCSQKIALIPFNRPHLTGKELKYIADAHRRGQLAGDGYFTKKCNAWLEKQTGCHKALLTHSCTAALEIAAILADIQPGDEIIMPSYTFVSTANAFVLRGATPVFVDIRNDTLNIDEALIESAITSRTRAIVPVHYAGVGCDMDAIMAIAHKHNLIVIEDAAQGVMATYKGRPLGSIGDLGCYSFHETKNIISGEGGALIVNNPIFAERAEIIREKGTDRSKFFRGQVDKYGWVDIGSSYLPGELIAAFLWAQMEEAELITAKRMIAWENYYQAFHRLDDSGLARRPIVPTICSHNAHMFYLLLSCLQERDDFIKFLKLHEVNCVFHYTPLHSSQFNYKFGATKRTALEVTDRVSTTLVRLPIWVDVDSEAVANVVESFFSNLDGKSLG